MEIVQIFLSSIVSYDSKRREDLFYYYYYYHQNRSYDPGTIFFGILSIRITETAMLTARNVLFTDSIGLESGHWTLFPPIAKDYERDNRDSDHLVMAFLLSNVGY